MFLDFLKSAGLVASIFAGIAAFFWIVITIAISRVNRGERQLTIEEQEEELEKLIDAEIASSKEKAGAQTKAAAS